MFRTNLVDRPARAAAKPALAGGGWQRFSAGEASDTPGWCGLARAVDAIAGKGSDRSYKECHRAGQADALIEEYCGHEGRHNDEPPSRPVHHAKNYRTEMQFGAWRDAVLWWRAI